MQGIREIMEFRSGVGINILIGQVTGTMSAFQLAFFFIIDGADRFIGFLGFFLLLISAASFTYSNVVKIDKQRNLVEKITQALFLKKRQISRVTSFRGVGIFKAAGSTGSRYWVKLLGYKNMSIPGLDPDYEDALMKAADIGQFLTLPVDEKPRYGMFWT